MMDEIDLQREREAALRRREDRGAGELRRRRARMILSGRWDASRLELKAAISERYPSMKPGEKDALLEVTLEVQQTERTRIDPDLITTMAPAPLRPEKRTLLAPVTRPPPAPKEDRRMAKKKFTPDQRREVRRWLAEWRIEHPSAKAPEALAALQEKFGVSITLPVFKRTYWLGAAPAKNGKRASAPSADEAAAIQTRLKHTAAPAANPNRAMPLLSRPSDDWDEGPLHPQGNGHPKAEAPAETAASPAALTPEQERHADSGSLPDGAEDAAIAHLERGKPAILNGGGSLRESPAAVGEAVEGERTTASHPVLTATFDPRVGRVQIELVVGLPPESAWRVTAAIAAALAREASNG